MRSSFLLAVAIATGVLCSSGCYMDGAWRAPTWNNMTTWWKKPDPSAAAMASGPSVQLPSSASAAASTSPQATTAGAAPAYTAATPAGAAIPAYDATKASYTNVSPNMYPNTGMASFNPPGAAPRANTASYDSTPRGSGGGYTTGGAYDASSGQNFAQAGPYDSVYGGRSQPSAPTGAATTNPYAAPATPAITDRSLAASAQQDRYADNPAATPATGSANHYLPAQNDPRVASRDPAPANNSLVSPGAVRTRQEPAYQPGVTGYNPGQTGYQPPANVGVDPTATGGSAGLPPNTASQPAYQNQATATPRESSWSPGGTSRYPGANPAATTAANTIPPATTTVQPPAEYRDPSAPVAPSRTGDPGRYDDMR